MEKDNKQVKNEQTEAAKKLTDEQMAEVTGGGRQAQITRWYARFDAAQALHERKVAVVLRADDQ